jgi:two-component system LytT family sensor kinase
MVRGGLVRLNGEQRAIAALIILFWLAFQLVFYTYGILGDLGQAVSPGKLLRGFLHYVTMPLELAIVGVGMAISLAVYFILRRVRRLRPWAQLLAAALVALACALSFTAAVSLLCTWFRVPWPALTPRFVIVDTLRWLAPFGLWAGMTLTVTYNSEMRDRERRLALLQAKAQDAQMRALRYQVNPHLLYNTLNSIAALILDGQNEQAEAAVLRLSSFFRASLSNDPLADVPLEDEVAMQRLYLDIEEMRFPNLSTEFQVPRELGSIPVPSLILQPLIENALKHGINPDGLPTHLKVRAARKDNQLVLEVSDNGPGRSPGSGTGVGIANVRERLISRFGERATVEAGGEAGTGFMVRLTMPMPA